MLAVENQGHSDSKSAHVCVCVALPQVCNRRLGLGPAANNLFHARILRPHRMHGARQITAGHRGHAERGRLMKVKLLPVYK